jgi:hypothetical protein
VVLCTCLQHSVNAPDPIRTLRSDDGGDKDPPRKNLEKSHIVYTFVKRKRNTPTTGLSIPETQETHEQWMLMSSLKNPVGLHKDY